MAVTAKTASADSDGYFCAAQGYLAVEFRSFSTSGISAEHVLKIVLFDDDRGPRWTGEVPLEDFQPHTMTCTRDTISIEGAGNRGRGLVSYTVKITNGVPVITAVSANPQYLFVPKQELPNLGLWLRPGIIPLESSGRHRFQLRMTRAAERRKDTTLLHDKKTVLEEVDETGVVIRSLQIFAGTQIETVD